MEKGPKDKKDLKSDFKGGKSSKKEMNSAPESSATGKMPGSGTKDNRHGLHTDHSTSRRTESRRQGSMGSESKSKSNRKNI